MGLGTQVIHFIRLDLGNDVNQIRGIGQITIMKEKVRTYLDGLLPFLVLYIGGLLLTNMWILV